jgi:hypothetical protein
MRTRDDLYAAFALLERTADELADGGDAEEFVVVPSAHHRPRRWSPLLLATAAVLMVAVTLGAILVATSLSRPSTGAGGTASHAMPVRALPFSFTGPVPVRITTWAIDVQRGTPAMRYEVIFSRAGMQFGLFVYEPYERGFIPPLDGATRVDVNGAHGYWQQPRDNASPGNLSWHWRAGAWALLFANTSKAGNANLVPAVARTIDFAGSTALRSPLSLPTVPPETRLVRWSYDVADREAPGFIAEYGASARSGTPKVDIRLVDKPWMPECDAPDGAAVAVGSRTGTGRAGTVCVRIDARHVLIVTRPGWSAERLTSLAHSVTIAARPDDRRAWFPARVALP